jgi:hypothetical protein
MRTPPRASLAALAAVAALSIAAATTSSAARPSGDVEHTPSTPGVGATCVIHHPDCNDMGFGAGGSATGDGGIVNGGPPVIAPPAGGAHGKKCGVISASAGPDGTVSYEPCQPPNTEPLEPRPQIVVPRSGMTGVRPIAFDSATVRPDDRTVDVRFWSGIEPCSVLDHVDVAYGSDTVTITLFEGSDPSAGTVACPDIAALKQVTVLLDQDLAGRRIVDGA